ncbi:hypothetical protein SS50377_25841 [Spironucleus salmonicida]|nr:hypothetical protein SS50377_25841 [Spironucleus salmonicida]
MEIEEVSDAPELEEVESSGEAEAVPSMHYDDQKDEARQTEEQVLQAVLLGAPQEVELPINQALPQEEEFVPGDVDDFMRGLPAPEAPGCLLTQNAADEEHDSDDASCPD